MQDQYTADVGDFGKYGLLRFVFPPPVRLGIVWCLYPNETHKSDGRHTAYLQRDDFRQCDPPLVQTMRRIIDSKDRNVAAIEKSDVLSGAVYFNEKLHFERPRIEARQRWFERAFERTSDCDCVFLDPDNGLQIASCARASKSAGKFVYHDELQPFIARRQTLVVYHHLCRRSSHLEQIKQRVQQLKALTPACVFALRYRAYSARVYFILPARSEQTRID